MKPLLKEGAGFPNSLLYTLAVIAGVSVANLYYNQPLLDMIRQDLGISALAANHIALYSQCGYALGLISSSRSPTCTVAAGSCSSTSLC